ncbi:MAG: sulfotransferase domain-containing protein [Chromatiales bacterium]|nr:MAG: sulfotransferase domain-containing protein [Chromatiales bacterium]
MLHTPIKKFNRFVVKKSVFFLPEEKRLQIERRHRGWEQYRKLRRADCAVASYGNSGRTWLRVMISRFYQVKHGFERPRLINFDNFHRRHPAIPKMFFTHDNFIKDYTGNVDNKADFYGCKTLLLARNPADVSVSQYFQWQHRMKREKKALNRFPPHGSECELFDFVMRPESGIPRIVDFLNVWANDMENLQDFLMVRYEDLRAEPVSQLRDILAFMGTPGTDEEVRDAVDYGSIENMKKLETKATGWIGGGRLKPRDKDNPDSYKVRRAKVGGYRDYFDDQQLAAVDRLLTEELSPIYGYGKQPEQRAATDAVRAVAGRAS